MSSELEVLRQRIIELEAKNAKLEAEKAEIDARNAELLKQVMEKYAKRDVENTELKSRVGELEARLAILEQGVTEVNGQPQNGKEVIAEVSAVGISDSVIDQQNDVNTKSIEDKEIGDFIPEEPANVSDSVIAQPKQCKPPQIEEVTTKVNHQGGSLEDRKTDAFLDEVHKKKVSDGIRQRNKEKKLLLESAQDLSPVTSDLSRETETIISRKMRKL